MIRGYLGESMIGRAARMGAFSWGIVNPRDFAEGKHRSTDDRPYGGGPGMVMMPDPLVRAAESILRPESRLLMMTPSGKPFVQADARRLVCEKHLVFLCGHYEGIDDRVRQLLQPEEFSIGDYVLTNGVLPAAVILDATVRLLPGVLGGDGATQDESFETGLLDFPQYTRPPEYRGLRVPEVLQSGNHAAVAAWRREQAERITLERRPDLAAKMGLPRPPPPPRRKKRRTRISSSTLESSNPSAAPRDRSDPAPAGDAAQE